MRGMYTTHATSVLWPLYSSTCISRNRQLRTGGFFGAKFDCPHAIALIAQSNIDVLEMGNIIWVRVAQKLGENVRAFHVA